MKVADLFAELGIKPDAASFKAAERRLVAFNHRVAAIQHRSQVRSREGTLGGFGRPKAARGGRGGLSVLGLSPGLLVGGGLAAGLAGAAREAMSFDAALTQLDVNSAGAIGSMGDFRAQVLDVSNATGLAREEVLAGSAQFVALTGDGKNAAEAMSTFARVARASGTPVDDIARAAAALKTNLDIDPAQFEDAFSVLIRGGKAGAVELKDFAGLLATLAPEAAKFKGGGGLEGLRELNALLQVTQRGAGSAGEAATQLSSLFAAVNTERFGKASGLNVFNTSKDDQGRTVKSLKSVDEILDMISNSKLARDPELMQKALGRKEAARAVTSLLKHRDAIREIRNETIGAKDTQEDLDKVMSSTSARAKKAWTEFKNVVMEEAGVPLLDAATVGLERLSDGFRGTSLLLRGEIKKLKEEVKAGQKEAADIAKSGVSQILLGEEGTEAHVLRRQLFGDRSTDPLADRGSFNLLDIVGRAAIAARPVARGEGQGVLIDAPATISTTINVNGASGDKEAIGREAERRGTEATRRELDRWARSIASEFEPN
jgi:TP901 family phage tail tape measure protein